MGCVAQSIIGIQRAAKDPPGDPKELRMVHPIDDVGRQIQAGLMAQMN